MPKISSSRLRHVRSARSLTQSRLAARAKVAVRQIQRIEHSHEDIVTVREATLSGLTKALSVEETVLSGAAPLPPELSVLSGPSNEVPADDTLRLQDFEARMVKLDGTLAIVEFNKSSGVGAVVARNIPDEATGLRLIAGYRAAPVLAEALEAAVDMGDLSFEYEELIHHVQRELDRFADVQVRVNGEFTRPSETNGKEG